MALANSQRDDGTRPTSLDETPRWLRYGASIQGSVEVSGNATEDHPDGTVLAGEAAPGTERGASGTPHSRNTCSRRGRWGEGYRTSGQSLTMPELRGPALPRGHQPGARFTYGCVRGRRDGPDTSDLQRQGHRLQASSARCCTTRVAGYSQVRLRLRRAERLDVRDV